MSVVEQQTTTPIDGPAATEAKRLHAREHQLDADLVALIAENADLERAAAEAVAEGIGEEEAIGALNRGKTREMTTRYAIDHVRRLRRDAIAGALAERAAATMARAKQINAEADASQAITDRLLAELSEHEQATYVPRGALARFADAHGAYFEGDRRTPKTKRLRAEADELRVRADRETRRQPEGGHTTGENLSALIAQVTEKPLDFAPAAYAIRAWASAFDASRAAASVKLSRDAGRPVAPLYRLVWRADGTIDEQRSRGVA
jgi:hypothetical protein